MEGGGGELYKLLMGYMPARWGSESVVAGETISGVARVFSAVVLKALVSAITIIVVIIVVTIIKTVPTILAVMPSIAARLPVPLARGGGAILVAAIRAIMAVFIAAVVAPGVAVGVRGTILASA